MKFVKQIALSTLICAGIANAEDCCFWQDLSFWVKGGVVPIVWLERNSSLCLPSTTLTEVDAGDFLRVFKVPWTVGAEVRWAMSDCNRVYLDFQYRQAKGNNRAVAIPPFFSPDNEIFRFGTYRTYSVYVGADHTSMQECLCENLSAFLGIKVGFTYENKLTLAVSSVDFANPTANCFKKRVVLSGGGRFGVHYDDLCDCLMVELMVEILGQAGPRFGSLAIPNNLLAQPAVVNAVSSEVLFPVTLGFGYKF